MRDHENAGQRLGEGIDIGVRNPALRQEVIAQEHAGEFLDVPQLEDREHAHAESDEPFRRADGEGIGECSLAGRQRHQGRHREDRDHRLVGQRLRIGYALAQEAPKIVIAADTRAIDIDLWRGLDLALRLEGVGFSPGLQPMVFDLEALAFQQRLRFEAEGAQMLVHHHAVEHGLAGGGHGELLSGVLPWGVTHLI